MSVDRVDEVPVITTRDDAVAFLDARIGSGVQPGLERITGLLAFMDDPQRSYPAIHVAGTNGKTTVSRMVQQILGAHGLATGGFTSPHLDRVEERFTVHGKPIDPDDFTTAVRDIAWFVVGYEQSAGTTVTYFEVTAALAFSIFQTAAVDVAVVEVGLGGRLDATNVLDADVAVITGIGIDHTEYLGDTVAQITAEKVAILGDGGTLVTGPLPAEAVDVVSGHVAAVGGNWIAHGESYSVAEATVAVGGWQVSVTGVFDEYPELYLPIHGRHQVDNLATAIAAGEMFLGRSLDHDLLEIAVAATTAPGRLEVVARHPVILLDGAHNVQGIDGLAATLDTEFPEMPWQLVIGVRGERAVDELVAPLRGLTGAVYATRADDPSSIDPAAVAAAARDTLGVPADTFEDVATALQAATSAAGPDGGVLVTGSLYVVGEARALLGAPADRSAEVHLRFDAETVEEVYEGPVAIDLSEE